MREEADEATGIINRVVIDSRRRTARPRPASDHGGADERRQAYKRLANGGDARYLLPVGAIILVERRRRGQAGDVMAKIPPESAKTKDITGGLPRVAELFEARKPKDCAVIAEIDGTRPLRHATTKDKRRIKITPEDGDGEPVEYLIPKGKHITVHDGDVIRKGESLMDGIPTRTISCGSWAIEALAEYLVNEIQEVYRLQGVRINDKHIEVIVRQMLQKVEILDPGDTGLLKGDQVDKLEFEEEQRQGRGPQGPCPPSPSRCCWASPRRRLQTRSFISAASFQETTRVLTEAAVQRQAATPGGLKENVIIGRLIPAGTGAYLRGLQRIATRRDEEIAAKRAVESIEEQLPDVIAMEAAAEAARAPAE